MFEFATGFGVAYSKGMTSVIAQGNVVNSIFNLTSNKWLAVMRDRSACNGAKGRGEARASGFDPNLINFKPDASYNLGLYLQSWKYFADAMPELHKQLVFRDHIRTKVDSIINNILKKNSINSRTEVTLIGVHVRRGDMVNNGFGYQVASSHYMNKAVQYFSDITNRIFVVCSNDMNWSKNNIPKNEKVEFMAGNPREIDLAILASCDHLISTVGSFSWWAGFLNKGTVLYYKWPAKEGSRLRPAYSKDYMDYFLPHWIGVN